VSRYFDLIQGTTMKERAFPRHSGKHSSFSLASAAREVSGRPPREAMLGLVQRVFFQSTRQPPRVVVFTGVDHGDGCSQIAASAAECLAASSPKASVCLVEANFRSPGLSTMLETTNYYGLTDALSEHCGIRYFVKPVCSEAVWLLSSGPVAEASPNLLSTESMRERCAELRREFDFGIIDTPPLARYTDAIPIAKLSDGVVLVVAAESTRREAARAAVVNLRSERIQVLGVVLNKRTYPIPELIYSRL
jgi:capsular exopolysaccharide synthesis family protein